MTTDVSTDCLNLTDCPRAGWPCQGGDSFQIFKEELWSLSLLELTAEVVSHPLPAAATRLLLCLSGQTEELAVQTGRVRFSPGYMHRFSEGKSLDLRPCEGGVSFISLEMSDKINGTLLALPARSEIDIENSIALVVVPSGEATLFVDRYPAHRLTEGATIIRNCNHLRISAQESATVALAIIDLLPDRETSSEETG